MSTPPTTLLKPGQPDPLMDPAFKSGSFPAITTFGFDRISPPSPLYIQRDDVLGIEVVSDLAAETVTIQGRMLLSPLVRGGQPDTATSPNAAALQAGSNIIEPIFAQVSTIGATQPPLFKFVPLSEGYLLSLSAIATNATQRGITFVRVFINRSSQGQNVLGSFVPLFSGYVASNGAIGWPYGRTLDPADGNGELKSVNKANPAAGADWSFQVPSSARTRIQSVNAQLAIANAGVARIIRVQIKDQAGNLVWQSAAQQTGAINTTVQVSIGQGQVSSVVDTTTLNITLPGVTWLTGAWSIAVNTSNIQAGDQWSAIWLSLEQLWDNV